MSTLRPHHATSGGKNQAANSTTDAAEPAQGRRRVRSLTHNNPASTFKHHFPRHSLHSQPTGSQQQPNWAVEEEMKRRRRLAWFGQSYGETATSNSDSEPESGETADDQEWKQVCKAVECK